MRRLALASVLALLLGIGAVVASPRKLAAFPATEIDVTILSASQAENLANALIIALTLPSTAATDKRAVTILGVAVNATSGVQTSAVILTRLSQYVDEVGCTPRVQSALRQTLNEQYGGSTTAMVNALRSLDVYYTNVQALGACLVQATSGSEGTGVTASGGGGS